MDQNTAGANNLNKKLTPEQIQLRQEILDRIAKRGRGVKHKFIAFILCFILGCFILNFMQPTYRKPFVSFMASFYDKHMYDMVEGIKSKFNKDEANNNPAGEENVPIALSLKNEGSVTINVTYAPYAFKKSRLYEGSLLLVNYDNPYQEPKENKLISLLEKQNDSFESFKQNIFLAPGVIEPLNGMMEAFYKSTGNKRVTISSGYRTEDYQKNLYDNKVNEVGVSAAMGVTAQPGYSEHHTGYALDLGVIRNGNLISFDGKGIYSWFEQNAHRYGFIKRYQGNKTGITGFVDESWHYRYVGKPHAYWMYNNNLCLEEYVEGVKKYTYKEPLYVQTDDNSKYAIYYVPMDEVKSIRVPENYEYEFSGNNRDGFIITIDLS